MASLVLSLLLCVQF